MYLAPPTYEESIAGISLIDVDDAALPRYPVYRFDFATNDGLVVDEASKR